MVGAGRQRGHRPRLGQRRRALRRAVEPHAVAGEAGHVEDEVAARKAGGRSSAMPLTRQRKGSGARSSSRITTGSAAFQLEEQRGLGARQQAHAGVGLEGRPQLAGRGHQQVAPGKRFEPAAHLRARPPAGKSSSVLAEVGGASWWLAWASSGS